MNGALLLLTSALGIFYTVPTIPGTSEQFGLFDITDEAELLYQGTVMTWAESSHLEWYTFYDVNGAFMETRPDFRQTVVGPHSCVEYLFPVIVVKNPIERMFGGYIDVAVVWDYFPGPAWDTGPCQDFWFWEREDALGNVIASGERPAAPFGMPCMPTEDIKLILQRLISRLFAAQGFSLCEQLRELNVDFLDVEFGPDVSCKKIFTVDAICEDIEQVFEGEIEAEGPGHVGGGDAPDSNPFDEVCAYAEFARPVKTAQFAGGNVSGGVTTISNIKRIVAPPDCDELGPDTVHPETNEVTTRTPCNVIVNDSDLPDGGNPCSARDANGTIVAYRYRAVKRKVLWQADNHISLDVTYDAPPLSGGECTSVSCSVDNDWNSYGFNCSSGEWIDKSWDLATGKTGSCVTYSGFYQCACPPCLLGGGPVGFDPEGYGVPQVRYGASADAFWVQEVVNQSDRFYRVFHQGEWYLLDPSLKYGNVGVPSYWQQGLRLSSNTAHPCAGVSGAESGPPDLSGHEYLVAQGNTGSGGGGSAAGGQLTEEQMSDAVSKGTAEGMQRAGNGLASKIADAIRAGFGNAPNVPGQSAGGVPGSNYNPANTEGGGNVEVPGAEGEWVEAGSGEGEEQGQLARRIDKFNDTNPNWTNQAVSSNVAKLSAANATGFAPSFGFDLPVIGAVTMDFSMAGTPLASFWGWARLVIRNTVLLFLVFAMIWYLYKPLLLENW